MSTRCVVNFAHGEEICAKVYRHSDGYPDGRSGVPADLKRFFKAVQRQTRDTRFADANYLAAKFIVWQAREYARRWDISVTPNKYRQTKRLDFLGVAPVLNDPGDIEYRYHIDCANVHQGFPTVTWERA